MRRVCIYSLIGPPEAQFVGTYIREALEVCSRAFDHVVLVCGLQAGSTHYAELAARVGRIVHYDKPIRVSLDGYQVALATFSQDELSEYDEIVFIDSSNFIVKPPDDVLSSPELLDVDFWSVAFFRPLDDWRIAKMVSLKEAMNLSFFAVRKNVFLSQSFAEFMRTRFEFADYLGYRVSCEHGLHKLLVDAGFHWRSFLSPAALKSSDPQVFEALDMLQAGSPILAKNIFSFDPLTIDMQAIDCRSILDWIANNTDYDMGLIWESILPYHELRHLCSNLDEMRIIDSEAPPLESLQFSGKIAVVAHVFYVDMLDEFCALAENIPCDFDFLISTSSEADKEKIDRRLETYRTGGQKIVRVVEQNRGRDMSSLFITFRDLMLSDDYWMVLRLHSKRTPQAAWHIGRSFKDHLTQNLVPSKGFVSRLLTLMQKPEYRHVGVVVPPLVHIGFGTLGHAWFSNRRPLEKVAGEMGIYVPLDEDTPVATYGTMYWFRPEALRPMFEREWRWEEYNPEPHHIDGGLAHVQERLICYCAQSKGFRTLFILNSAQAERNYLKLEYKLQKLASYFSSGDIREQCASAAQLNSGRTLSRVGYRLSRKWIYSLLRLLKLA